MKTLQRRGLMLGGAVLLATVPLLMAPERVPVEVAPVTQGPLVVTVDASARTRVRQRWVVAAPATGRLARIGLRPGDAVTAGTVIAEIGPPAAPPLDPRARADFEARVAAAAATLDEAAASVRRAAVGETQAARELTRLRPLFEANVVSAQDFDNAGFAHEARAAELKSAELARETAARNVAVARAQLVRLGEAAWRSGARAPSVPIHAPVDGRVLRVLCESDGPVQAGTPLLELGDPSTLEAVVEVLTADAVGIAPGASVLFERWGGAEPLRGKVRLVEPSGFTKVSALGVEEQRVNVVVDPEGGPNGWPMLGDGYRLEARIVVWEAETTRVPLAALARDASGWSAFVIRDGRAQLRRVEVGRRAVAEAQATGGIAPGDLVALHPSASVRDGARVTVVR